MTNAERIAEFYDCFTRRDGAGMAACYHPDIRFSDPVFPDIAGPRAGAMWRMLCARGKDLRIESSDIRASERSGSAHWEAWYTFAATGRPVHNVIDATFSFDDGLIVRHVDRFSFWRWSSQALGATGALLGWTPLVRGKVRAQAAAALDKFLGQEPVS
jgi:ketosteroid isomerase-like protein